MSIESAKRFVERMKKDEDFAKQFVESEEAEKRTRIVRTAGFDFTPAELGKAVGGMRKSTVAATANGGQLDCLVWSMNLQRFFR